MVPNTNVSHAGFRQTKQVLLGKNSTYVPRQHQKTCQEITQDLLERQSEYERLNKTYTSIKFSSQGHFFEKKKQFNVLKLAVRQARLKFLEKSSSSQNTSLNHNQYFLQQQNSIAIIAQDFRNQKSTLTLRSKNQNQLRNTWTLELILIIGIPMICLLVIIFEFISLS